MDKPTLDTAFWQQLADHNPIGMQLSADDARNWFDFIWLKYSTHGYRNHKRAIISWWGRIREYEIEDARGRSHALPAPGSRAGESRQGRAGDGSWAGPRQKERRTPGRHQATRTTRRCRHRRMPGSGTAFASADRQDSGHPC